MEQAPFALWAMHPVFLADHLKRGSLEAMLPDGLKTLMGMASPQEAKAQDPVREGATLILPIFGLLGPRGMNARTYYDDIAQIADEAAVDPKVGAVVLHVRSPGGYVYGCEEAGDALWRLRQAKPVATVASPYAFSAAYWLGSQGSAFYATTSGEVGSLGVRSGHIDVSGFEQKIGMVTTLIASSADKIAAHPYAPLSDEDRAELQASVDESNARFVAAVARGRGLRPADVAAIHGQGATFSAQAALARGAIDGVATLAEVVAKVSSSRNRLSLMRRQAAARSAALTI